jgi:hypothetical protein
MTGLVWMNLPLCALVFLAIAGIPLWLVLTRGEWGPENGSPARDHLPPATLAGYVGTAEDELALITVDAGPALVPGPAGPVPAGRPGRGA